MMSRSRKMMAWLLVAGVCCGARRGAAAEPKVVLDLADPQSALTGYFEAQKANDQASMLKAIAITDPAKKNYVEYTVLYLLWQRYLERQAIAKFGKEEGMKVEGHIRTLDEQTDLDLKRVKDANVQYNTEKTTATLFLRIERGRPDNLQTDDFTFLDEYDMVKTAAGWQVDALKTWHRFDADSADNCKSELAAFPRMSRNLKGLADSLKAGKFKTADDLKSKLEDLWTNVYAEPTDAAGRTEKEADSEPAASQPATTQPGKSKEGP